ncbi:MAG: cyclic pyranopterin monophosphate synthase MoaC [Myxococcota bacterium]
MGFNHLDENGAVRMVDVSDKPSTKRTAEAEAVLWVGSRLMEALRGGALAKGDALALARIAGIAATKRCAELIPLAHPLPLTHARIELDTSGDDSLKIRCRVETVGPTGVEMEAMTGASVAALTVYDMCKGVRRDISLREVVLVHKSGGRSGTYQRPD